MASIPVQDPDALCGDLVRQSDQSPLTSLDGTSDLPPSHPTPPDVYRPFLKIASRWCSQSAMPGSKTNSWRRVNSF